jgi:hypothetical protein
MAQTDKLLLQLFQDIVQYFDLDELRTLSFSLAVDWGNLSGDNKPTRVISLISHLARRKRIGELLVRLQEERPAVQWPDIDPDVLVDLKIESLLTSQGTKGQQASTSKNTISVADRGTIKIGRGITQKGDENIVAADAGGDIEAGWLIQESRKM